ncbi:proto-oncogene tyrosine-protein kinase ROS isoform X3 [Lepeophtheirus salmonis]|uniref:proto-oncogene tyrosine-protein kinase ROS isoform X3 n=1 Tax=Lepeophtheirus salmonis TaxID=72036 RepID=UPI001AEB1121|nr:proto-oncogene tyrosine-protein kinase ROS-like isoform X3 [Lepeophtheirus salmonis]
MKVIINLVLIFLMIITSGKITKCVVLNKNDNRVLSDSLLNQPKLNIDTLTSTSVSINWSFSSNISGVNYYLEISMNMGAFIPTYHYQKYCNEWSVQDLIPYTRYTFRISLFKDDIFIGHSAPSLVVTTLPGGRPSAPRLITINQKNLYDATIDISVEEENVSMTPVYITYICQLPHINWIQQEKKIEYNISLYAINANGEDGDTAFYIAYFHSQIQEETKKVLLFSEGPILYRKFIRNDEDIFSPHTPILKLNSNIISISGIVRLNQSIILDQMGTLYIVSNVYSSNTIEIKTVNNTKKIRGSEIDIDWLNNLVYFLDLKRKNIFKCDIPKFENPYLKGCVILKIELEGSLKHLKVDPYNGFIYWIQDDNILIGTNMIGEKKILFSKSVFLSSFSILMKNNYILIPDIIHSRLYTVNLWENKEDFKEAKVFESHCNGLRYITSKNRSSFFWSNHEGLNFQKFTEKYGYLNIIIEQGLNISDILYFDNTNQPFPYPLNPVTGIQVFFYSRLLSIITWKPPFESRLLGFGAWRSWKYNIMVENLKNRRIQQLHSIQCCRYSLPNLNYSTVYKFRIRVEVESSSSSWSVPFITKTFDQENRNAMLVWSSNDSIYLSKSIFPHSDVKKIKINFKISEMSGPYCLTDLGKVCSIFPPMIIYNISSIRVLSIAYESIGSQLYISNGSIISRYNIKTFREEILLSVKARSTFLSSSMAIMCWISYSQKDLECSNLNGEGIQKVFAIPTWKNYVILTMCLSEKKDDIFFFIVAQSSLEYRLYHGWNILNIIQFRIIDSYDFFRYNFVNSNLINLSGKLLWKSNLTSFFFYDINGNSITEVPISKNITSFQLITHHQQSVIELHPINVTQLRIEGERKSFFLKWNSSQEFQFRISINSKPFRTILKNYIRILNSNNKDSFNLSIYYRNIRTFSPILNTVLTPPESKPEPPKNVRAFKIKKK